MPRRPKKIKIFYLLVLTAITEGLYGSIAFLGREWNPPVESPGPFEAGPLFLAPWAGLLVAYGLALKHMAPVASRKVTLYLLVTSALFRATLIPAQGLSRRAVPGDFRDDARINRPQTALPLDLLAEVGRMTETDPVSLLKFLTVSVDLAALALTPRLLDAVGLPGGMLVIYGWNPLAIKESASGRVEVVLSLFLFSLALHGARGRSRIGPVLSYGIALATDLGSGLSKIAGLPVMIRALGLWSLLSLFLAIGLWLPRLATFPWGLDFPPTNDWGSSLLPLATTLLSVSLTRDPVYPLALCFGIWGLFLILRSRRRPADGGSPEQDSLLALGGLLMILPRVWPWFFVPIAYFSPFSPNRGWLFFTATAPLTYLAFETLEWSFWLGFLQYFPAYCALTFFWLGGSQRS